MSEWEIVRHQVAIAGRVTDAETGKPIRGARVSLGSGPETFTAADGHFHFLDLPAGKYTLQASLPGARTRYGRSDKMTVTVKWNKQGKITLAMADLALPPLTGQANKPAPPAPAGGEQPPPATPAAADQSVVSQKKKRSKAQPPQPPKPTPAAGSKQRAGKKSRE